MTDTHDDDDPYDVLNEARQLAGKQTEQEWLDGVASATKEMFPLVVAVREYRDRYGTAELLKVIARIAQHDGDIPGAVAATVAARQLERDRDGDES